jgi:hypothetical protein
MLEDSGLRRQAPLPRLRRRQEASWSIPGPNQGQKQQTLQVANGLCPWQAAAGYLAPWVLIPDSKAMCMKIVGYINGIKRGAGSPPLLSSFSESVTK